MYIYIYISISISNIYTYIHIYSYTYIFRLPGHNLNKHAKFTLIEQLNDTNIDKKLLKHRLKKREGFWIIKLKTLQTNGFNAELNFQSP